MTVCDCGEPAEHNGKDGKGICPRCRRLAAASRELGLKKKSGVKFRPGIGVGQAAMNWENHWGDTKPIAGIGDSLKALEEKLCHL